MLYGWDEFLIDLLLPKACQACLEDLPPPIAGPLCGTCLGRLELMKPPWCARCGRSLPGGGSCRDCRDKTFSLDRIRAAFPYKGPIPPLLRAFKYRGQISAGETLAGWMAGMFFRFPELWGADAVVPVPLHPERRRERGFNQAALLARPVAAACRRPIEEALERRRNTPPQWRLARAQRPENLRGAFAVKPASRPMGRSFLLIDDVCTTGETLESCARALKAAGASRISAFALARD